jgi:hypothetical protein
MWQSSVAVSELVRHRLASAVLALWAAQIMRRLVEAAVEAVERDPGVDRRPHDRLDRSLGALDQVEREWLECQCCGRKIVTDEQTATLNWHAERFDYRTMSMDVEGATTMIGLCAACGVEMRPDIEAAVYGVLDAHKGLAMRLGLVELPAFSGSPRVSVGHAERLKAPNTLPCNGFHARVGCLVVSARERLWVCDLLAPAPLPAPRPTSRSRAPGDPSQPASREASSGPALDREPLGRVREGSTGRPGPAPADAARERAVPAAASVVGGVDLIPPWEGGVSAAAAPR